MNQKKMPSYHELFTEYQKYVTLKNYQTGGRKGYTQAITEFFQFLKQRGYAQFHITGEDLSVYYHHLQTRPKKNNQPGTLSQTTINHHLFAIRILFDYMLNNHYVESLPLIPKYLRNKKEPLPILTIDEVKLLYQATTNKCETALISIAYGCGLRRSEIADLHLSDIDLKKANLIVRHGKGNKRREVPLSDKVIADLKDYIYHERSTRYHSGNHLFITPKGHIFSGAYMNIMIKKIAKRVPELVDKKVTLHTLRRSIATHLIEKGASIHFVKEFLGHSEIDTAQLYAIRRKRQAKLA